MELDGAMMKDDGSALRNRASVGDDEQEGESEDKNAKLKT